MSAGASNPAADLPGADVATAELRAAAQAKKCWSCGCLRDTLAAIERATPSRELPAPLADALTEARGRLVEIRYDCLGCATCHPALAANALNEGGGLGQLEACATEDVSERPGWPPLPGSYTVLRANAPVAACTLTDAALADAIARERPAAVSIVGTLLTENLGIERLVRNVLANPGIRFVVVAGADSPGRVGHLPGASLIALAREGIDARGRIIGAPGRRPVLRNLETQAIRSFRERVEVIDCIGRARLDDLAPVLAELAARAPAEPPAGDVTESLVPPRIRGAVPERMTLDPAGWFVVDPDRRAGRLIVEHYTNAGVLDAVIEAEGAGAAYSTAIARGLVTRLDHAAYLGKELARAEVALRDGSPYVQDAAPERVEDPPDCGCASSCGGAG